MINQGAYGDKMINQVHMVRKWLIGVYGKKMINPVHMLTKLLIMCIF